MKASASRLRADEAIVFFLISQFEVSYAFAIDRTHVSWSSLAIKRSELEQNIGALRCGIELEQWTGSRKALCTKLLGKGYDTASELPPFPTALAYDLYRRLLAPLDEAIAVRNLLILSDRDTSALPFNALLTRPPAQDALPSGLSREPWLLHSHAITLIPSLSSFVALRSRERSTPKKQRYLGIGNPLLKGNEDGQFGRHFRAMALAARQRSDCENGRSPVRLPDQVARGGEGASGSSIVMRSGVADTKLVEALVPLPETADEICAIAGSHDVLLAARATETEVKSRSEAGKLLDYTVIHFATHGLLAGDIKGVEEPALVLSPPARGTERDDGLLTASEIARLKLDADLAILSACDLRPLSHPVRGRVLG